MPASPTLPENNQVNNVYDLIRGFERLGYITDRALATAVYLVLKLRKPLLIEGHAGLGKTEVAKVLAAMLGTRLIRLQCYEGLDVSSAVYEWNYQKQLLAIKIQERTEQTVEEKEKHIFGREFLLERPLLQSILAEDASPVLLIDEIDRPEMGTITAKHVPFVILTSNRTRDLSDALKRRCLYHWIDYPSLEKEMKIVRTRLPGVAETLGSQAVKFVQAVRQMNISKPPGVAETLDWVEALQTLGKNQIDAEAAEETLGCISKSAEDAARIKAEGIEKILSETA
jgi:MoxR-like ATPase